MLWAWISKSAPCLGRVVGLDRLTHDVMRVQLKLPQNQRFSYLSGQYIDLLLRDGRRRSFSMASPPNDEGVLELHVRRVPGGFFTNYVFDAMRVKELLRLQGPFGTFFLREDSDVPAVLVAGGTGFAPIKALVEDAVAHEDKRPMRLYWGIRTTKDLYLKELLDQWASSLVDFQYQVVVSDPDPDTQWAGATGWVHEAVISDYPDLSGLEVYASGPPPMIDAIKENFQRRGLSEERAVL